MKATLQIIKEARDIIADPLRWTRGHFATNAGGEPRVTFDPDACKFCAAGALLKAMDNARTDHPTFLEALRALDGYCDGDRIVFINDQRGHVDTLRVFDRTIAALEATQ